MQLQEVMDSLRGLADPARLQGMARYGIPADSALGVSIPELRALARKAGRDHELALELWGSGVHEAMILSTMVDEPEKVSEARMEEMVTDLGSWDLCDQSCNNLFRLTPIAWKKSREWCRREEEFERRAGFVLMAVLAVHDKKTGDGTFIEALDLVKEYGSDPRNFVRKAVNWALRQIGKRNLILNAEAIRVAEEMVNSGDRTSRWIASDALRELKNDAMRQRLMSRER